MHYHNVFLVKSENKQTALEQTKKFLEPFDENLEVTPYKEYQSESEFKRMQEYYTTDPKGSAQAKAMGINPANKQDLISLLKNWDGNVGGIDDKGVYYLRTSNPQGEYDWYTVGGRWPWSKLEKEYEKYIIRPPREDMKGTFYWNEYHDVEVIGKHCTIVFPDGTQKTTSYGMNAENAISDWVEKHPYETEILDATDAEFFAKIEPLLGSIDESKKWWLEQQEEYKTKHPDSTMANFYQNKLDAIGKHWQIEAHFWNVTDNTSAFDKEAILKDPTHWFIVNMDFHD